MNEFRLKIIFALIFVFSFTCIIKDLHFFPAVRFPQFPNKKMGASVSYTETQLYNCGSDEKVDLMALIQPFDKQYFLFSQRALANEKAKQSMLIFLDSIYERKYSNEAKICLSVEEKTVTIP